MLSADTEGIRRGLVFLEDEMLRREGSVLKIGIIERKPHITARISRCYFTPASCTDNEREDNELIDDIDYYPDEYLNRLAHDGINALWLGATLQHLVKSDIVPEYGATAEKRMKKLNAVIEKCRRYGIKTYLFSVDPASTYKNEKLFLNIGYSTTFTTTTAFVNSCLVSSVDLWAFVVPPHYKSPPRRI